MGTSYLFQFKKPKLQTASFPRENGNLTALAGHKNVEMFSYKPSHCAHGFSSQADRYKETLNVNSSIFNSGFNSQHLKQSSLQKNKQTNTLLLTSEIIFRRLIIINNLIPSAKFTLNFQGSWCSAFKFCCLY